MGNRNQANVGGSKDPFRRLPLHVRSQEKGGGGDAAHIFGPAASELLQRVPDELWVGKVFSFLPVADIVHGARLVNRSFAMNTVSTFLWKTLLERDFGQIRRETQRTEEASLHADFLEDFGSKHWIWQQPRAIQEYIRLSVVFTKSHSEHVRCVFLGADAVGKSTLLHRRIRGEWTDKIESTIGAAFVLLTETLSRQCTVALEFWDTAGVERYHSLSPIYYRSAHVAAVMYDPTRPSSFEKAKQWISEVSQQGPAGILFLLIAGKSDLPPMVLPEVAHKYIASLVEKNGARVSFVSVSARTGEGVEEVFRTLARLALHGSYFHSLRQWAKEFEIVEK